jgi:membrane dipeptidase
MEKTGSSSTALTTRDGAVVSAEARALAREAEFIDLHLDTFIPPRLWGYDPLADHAKPLFGGRFFGHSDLPRMDEGELSGGMWSITTNPFRTAKGRWRTFQKNLKRFEALVARSDRLEMVRNVQEYRAARARSAHAVLLSVQGGNAFDAAPNGPASIGDRLTRVTVVHLTNAKAGATSSPVSKLRRHRGLSDHGRTQIEQLNSQRIFVDLAHIHPDAFWDAHDAHDHSQPLIVTHTGVRGVKPHWRNLDDRQIKAIADSGGVVGIMFHRPFLNRKDGPTDGAMVVEHMEHVIRIGGEDAVAIGTDYDGAITPPPDLRSAASYPRLVQIMLDRGWSAERITKALGLNFLRCFERLRPAG